MLIILLLQCLVTGVWHICCKLSCDSDQCVVGKRRITILFIFVFVFNTVLFSLYTLKRLEQANTAIIDAYANSVRMNSDLAADMNAARVDITIYKAKIQELDEQLEQLRKENIRLEAENANS